MMNSARLIFRQPLDNGLTLELWDHSRPVAGDRWFVALETRIAIPVHLDTLPPELKPQVKEIVAALGDEIIFSQRDERNFIAALEVPGLLQDMQDWILGLAPLYFGHADFAARFIRKTWAAYQDRQRWQGLATQRGDHT